jgi:hypothetical protein
MRKMLAVICALAALVLWGCGHKEKPGAAPAPGANAESPSSAKIIDDIFPAKSEIPLELTPESALAVITDIAVDAKGNIFVADGVRLNQVWIFGPNGKFLRKLGRSGQGPGEYTTPLSLAVNRDGEILVNDYLGMKILFYDREYRHERDLKAPRGQYVHTSGGNRIYLYEGMLPSMTLRRGAFNTIKEMDQAGKLVFSFAPTPEEILKINFSRMADGMDIDKSGFIYEMNPLSYHIRKYSPSGKLIKSFTNPHVRPIGNKDERPPTLNGPLCLDNGLVIVQREKELDFFDSEGNLIVSGIPAVHELAYARGDAVYFVAWEEGERGAQQSNPTIICYH